VTDGRRINLGFGFTLIDEDDQSELERQARTLGKCYAAGIEVIKRLDAQRALDNSRATAQDAHNDQRTGRTLNGDEPQEPEED